MKAARALPRKLTHLDARGKPRMVDVTRKPVTVRTARARARLRVAAATMTALRRARLPKGNAIEVARVAGLQASKWTHHLIPLCHPLRISHADVAIELVPPRTVVLESIVTAEDRTGVEMEALTAVTVAALTFYDMVKAIDRGMVIERVELIEKTGGRSGTWRRRRGAADGVAP